MIPQPYHFLIIVAVVTSCLFCAQAQSDSSGLTVKTSPKSTAANVKPSAKKDTTISPKKSSMAKSAAVKADTLVMIGRLLEIPGKMPPNDLYNYVYILKFHVMAVKKGNLTNSEIMAGVYNPLIPRKEIKDKMASLATGDVEKFEAGAKYKLTLILPISKVWKDAVEDEYIDSDADKYYALKVEMAN